MTPTTHAELLEWLAHWYCKSWCVKKCDGPCQDSKEFHSVAEPLATIILHERAAAYLAGRRAGREDAAKVADNRAARSVESGKHWGAASVEKFICEAREDQALTIAAAIRSLP